MREPLRRDRKVCQVCGKEFFAIAEWKFRKKWKKNGYYCSRKCFKKAVV